MEFPFFHKIKTGLTKTRELFNKGLETFFTRDLSSQEIWERLEEILIASDVGLETTERLLEGVKKRKTERLSDQLDGIKELLKEEIFAVLSKSEKNIEIETNKPFVILLIGINGAGKTTNLAKMANLYVREGKKVMIVAGDTFRAAAIEQLEILAKGVGANFIKQQRGGDSSAVVYDALTSAKTKEIDLVLVDTGGRLHTQRELIEELKKIKRVMGKVIPSSPHETILVLDATLGQNSFVQAQTFLNSVGVTGIVLTKLDGTSKGGIIINISARLNLPIYFIGVGESLEDIVRFEAKTFVEALFSQ